VTDSRSPWHESGGPSESGGPCHGRVSDGPGLAAIIMIMIPGVMITFLFSELTAGPD
jgi:hypothetical protein